jgi:aristolochene synthase
MLLKFDFFCSLLSALMRLSMDIHLYPTKFKHISVVNDIFSWEKELQASQAGHTEGAAICSAVRVLADEANLTLTLRSVLYGP